MPVQAPFIKILQVNNVKVAVLHVNDVHQVTSVFNVQTVISWKMGHVLRVYKIVNHVKIQLHALLVNKASVTS